LSVRDKFFIKVSEGLSTGKKMKQAMHLQIMPKSARSRAVDSPPMTLQTVVIERSSNIAGNGLPLAAGGDLEALNCQPAPKLNRCKNFHFAFTATCGKRLLPAGVLSLHIF
jgi:hypothetical protein